MTSRNVSRLASTKCGGTYMGGYFEQRVTTTGTGLTFGSVLSAIVVGTLVGVPPDALQVTTAENPVPKYAHTKKMTTAASAIHQTRYLTALCLGHARRVFDIPG